jgi:hypothetical protein
MTRLEALLPELAEKLRQASAARQRAASTAACEFAISHAKVEHPLVEKALEKVRKADVLSPKEKTDIDALVTQFDEEYFAAQEAAEEGRASPDESVRLFGRARAVAALSFAGNGDAFETATEAIYEAAATTDDKEELTALIQTVLE